jgi:glycosyltransferase involved in cell wall biosynthesis
MLADPRECPLSVVIPVRDGAAVIGHCLRALAEVETVGQKLEVIVVDNGSKDDTAAVVRSFAEKLNLRMVDAPGVSIAAVRNAGAARARGDLLAFLDADCVVPRKWVRVAAGYPWDERSGAIGCFFSAGENSTWIARTWSRFEGSKGGGAVDMLPCGNMIVRRRVFEAAGGFDEGLESNEDAEFCHRLRSMQLRIEVVPELEAVHLGAPRTVRALCRREVWHGGDVLAVFLRSGANARAVAFALYFLLGMGACGVAAGWWAWTGDWQPTAAALAALAAAPAAVSVRSAIRSRRVVDLAPLAFLLAVYGVARAFALLRRPATGRSRNFRRGDAGAGVAINGQ